jgi:MFS transporter, FHS family, L-fucose permease
MSTKSSNYTYQITIIGILFAVFGLVTWLNGILIPFLKKSCELTDQQSYYVATAFFAAYFFLALPASWILNRIGTKNGMTLGLVIMAIGSAVFIPAAGARSFSMFLTGLFIQGAGLALLQTAANPYVSVIGPIESAATRISIMGICNKLMGIVGNLILASVLLKNSDEVQKQIDAAADAATKSQLLNDLAGRVVMPYSMLAIFLVLSALVIKLSSLPDIKEQTGDAGDQDTALSRGKTSIFQFPHVWLGALAIFFYVGAEVMAGDLIGSYGKNLGLAEDRTKYFTSFGLVGLLVGYLTNIILIPRYVKQETWLTVSAILGLILSVVSYMASAEIAVASIVAMGFANAVMWPAIFPLGIRDLGRFTQTGSALLVMGIVGGAILPPLYGWLYEQANIGLNFRSAYFLMMFISYAYVLWFGTRGHKI